MNSDRPIIATGHQAWLWHPGILAKDIAMRLACDRLGATPLHLVVDQDAHEALTLDLPVEDGDVLSVRQLRLGSHRTDVPTGAQSPIDAQAACAVLREANDPRLASLIEAFTDLPGCRTLAQQLAAVLVRLMRPIVGDVPLMFTSDMPDLPGYGELLHDLLHDAAAAVRHYNAAVAATPEAGIGPLAVERERIELPLWAVQWNQPRQRVYADLADSNDPIFTFSDGEPIDQEHVALLPRALLLTAVMRSSVCDLFIHGKGGGIYDRITEQWWQTWRSQTLAPMAVVSADLYLNFSVPTTGQDELAKARWFAHHLPHNVDRVLQLDGPIVRQKRDLLAHMHENGDRLQRQLAFAELHRFNAELLHAHPELATQMRERLGRARQGVANAAIAARRDWCFALYPLEELLALRDRLAGTIDLPEPSRLRLST